MLTIANLNTALLPANARGSGQIIYFDPITPEGLATGNGFLDLGYFPEGTRISPNVEVTREDLMAAGRESGASVRIASVVSNSTIGYEIPVLTPDTQVRALHAGAGAVTAAGETLSGVRAYQINPEAAVVGRFVFVKKRPGGPHTVVWHPRFELSANGTGDGDANSEVLNFVGSVQAYSYTPAAAFADLVTAIGQYGVMFEAPTDAALDALLTALDTEAVPEAPAQA